MTLRIADIPPARTCSRFRSLVCSSTVFYKGRLCRHGRHSHIFGNRYRRHRHRTVDLVTVASQVNLLLQLGLEYSLHAGENALTYLLVSLILGVFIWLII